MKVIFSTVTLLLVISVCSCETHKEDLIHSVQNLPEGLDTLKNLKIYDPDTEPLYDIQLSREQLFTSTPEVWIGYIKGFTVDHQGRVFIGDIKRKTIHVFQPDGRYVTSIGRKGRGPGEFSELTTMRPKIRSNQLFLYDEFLHRINVYSLHTLSSSHTINMDVDQWNDIEKIEGFQPAPRRYYVLGNRAFLIPFVRPFPMPGRKTNYKKFSTYERENQYYFMDMNGNLGSDPVLRQKEIFVRVGSSGPVLMVRTPFSSMPFVRNSLMAVAPDGEIFSAWTNSFLIKVYSSKGSYLRSFYYDLRNYPLNKGEVIEAFSNAFDDEINTRRLGNTKFPDTWQVLDDLLIDDQNRLWISTITDNNKYYQWWVLNDKGKLLAKFKWPGNRHFPRYDSTEHIKMIKNDYLYTIKSGSQIIRYRIKMK